MSFRKFWRRALLCLLFACSLLLLIPVLAFGQSVSSSVNGVLIDPTDAAISGASCRLSNQRTGMVLSASSGLDGLFTFPTVLPGTYTLAVQAAGFKALEMKNIVVAASEIRTLGRVALQLGEVTESVSVTAEAAALQLASAERSGTVIGSQLNDIALKGRDFFALLQTIPGVVDTNAAREITSNTAGAGIYIHGNRDNQKDFSVDGMVTMDTHSNGSLSYMPNMDAIAEIRILTSNYQAEYGRNSGGAITAITKSGSHEFHGSAYNFYRHESLNANNFFSNRTGTEKLPYRYRISGYSIGGPIYIPTKFNVDKEKFFFFWSQEYTGVKLDHGAKFVNTPTAQERSGDFSRSYDVNGALIPVNDPLTGKPFPGNVIPKDRINQLGQSILSFYPLPNYTDPDPKNLYRWNHRAVYSGVAPRRNDILRLDANLTPTWHAYYRYGRDTDNTLFPWGGKAGSVNILLSPVFVERYGTGHLVQATKIFSPTLINEITFANNMVWRDYDYLDPEVVARSRMGNPPQWYPDPNVKVDYIPTVTFGGQPANPVYAGLPRIPNRYRNPVHTITDKLSKVSGSHHFKVGISIERMVAEDPTGGSYRGSFDFSRDSSNPFDSNHSFANALLGNFKSYSEAQKQMDTRMGFWNVEWYVQDNWKVSERLTLDIGVRFYHMPPIAEIGSKDGASFNPALFDPRQAPALYMPARDASGRRVAKDPISGNLAIAPLIGLYVLGTGDPTNGMMVAGTGDCPVSLYRRPWLAYGPRFGFAYDLFGKGKTALRGGWGWFHDTGQNNPYNASVGNPPSSYTPTLSYGSLDTYAQGGGAIGPSDLNSMFGHHKLSNTMNFSFGIQHQIWGMVVDASYVGGLSRHLFLRRELNPIPMYARFDPQNFDPTQSGKPLPDNFLRPYAGHGSLRVYENVGNSNYNSLQVAVNRRFTRGLQFGIAYTYAKALGIASGDSDTITAYFSPRERNYGPLSFDRSQTFVMNYMYDLPKVGTKLGWKPARWVLDNWQISGVTSFITGAPFTPGFSTVDGQDITGSSEGARITVVGDPRLDKGARDFYRNFNTGAFARTPKGDFGNAGVGILRGPGINNWDMSVSKRVPLWSEERFIRFRTELFNAWNHTQFAGLYTSARFDVAGKQVDPNFGAYSSARAPRIIQLSLKVIF